VLLHGRGADEHDLFSLTHRLPPNFCYVSLRGFLSYAGGGYTWFESRGAGEPIAKSLRTTVRALRNWLDDAIAAERRAPVYLFGFSAGMMMAGALLLDEPQRFAGAILLSGALPLDSGLSAEPGRLGGIPIFYARGTLDDVIPLALVARCEAYLRERSGADLTFREYAHAHQISSREVDDIGAWLNERT
jgi:phospholipase/carboxylesterase